MVQFGKEFRDKYFSSLKDIVPVNHGSYGAPPDSIIEKFFESIKHDLSFADNYSHFELPGVYLEAVQAVGKVFNVDYHNLAIVTSATSGVNAVLRSFPFKKGDKVVVHDTAYGTCRSTLDFLKTHVGIEVIEIVLKYPIENSEIILKFEETIKNEKPRFVLFDGISSKPAVRIPFEDLIKLTAKYGALSIVDGAHCIGQIPIDLTEIKPDFLVSNLHKWFYVPRGCAALYVDPKHHRMIQSNPIGHGYVPSSKTLTAEEEKNLLFHKFSHVSTSTYGQISVIPDAVKFREEVCGGEQAIAAYCSELAREVGQKVSQKWNTSFIDDLDDTLIDSMVNIEIPLEQIGIELSTLSQHFKELEDLVSRKLAAELKVYAPIFLHNSKLYVRYSAQTYTEFNDFDYASDQLLVAWKEVISLFFSK